MRNKFYSLLLLVFISTGVYAQKLEGGIIGGVSYYSGDLTTNFFGPLHPAGGLLCRYNLNSYLSLKGDVIIGRVSANDADNPATSTFKLARNLSFESRIAEFTGQIEVNFLSAFKGKDQYRICVPYGFVGLGIFRFNPMANYFDPLLGQNTMVDLQPLGTEGQGLTKYPERKRYNLTSVCFPLGLGLKFHISRQWNIGLEFGARKTTTDYLDDVSTTYVERDLIGAAYGPRARAMADRSGEINGGSYMSDNKPGLERGNPSTQDWYGFSGLWVTYTFKGKSLKCNQF